MDRDAVKTLVGRVLAVIVLSCIFFVLGYKAGYAEATAWPDYRDYDPAQLSWVAEGIQERMSDLQDELDYVREVQASVLEINTDRPGGPVEDANPTDTMITPP